MGSSGTPPQFFTSSREGEFVSETESSRGAVVVPAVDAPSPVVFLRSLGRRGIDTITLFDGSNSVPYESKYCTEAYKVPNPSDDLVGYKNALLTLAKRDDVQTIVPLREHDTHVLSRYRSEFAEHITPLWPAFDTLRKAQDRVVLAEEAAAAGVSSPRTELLDEIDDWDRNRVVKTRYTLVAQEYMESLSESESVSSAVMTHLDPGVEPDKEAIIDKMGHVPIAQEFVPGDEYAVWAIYEHGEPVVVTQRLRVRGFKYTGGASVCRRITDDSELESLTRSLLDRLNWHGPASVQFIKDDETGEFKLMEINPRFWASVACAVQAGIDFPYYYWRLGADESYRPDPDPGVGTVNHMFRGELLYLLSILTEESPYVERPSFWREALEVTSSMYEYPNFDFLSRDDPKPFVADLVDAAKSIR